jgi:hypothetical protein
MYIKNLIKTLFKKIKADGSKYLYVNGLRQGYCYRYESLDELREINYYRDSILHSKYYII